MSTLVEQLGVDNLVFIDFETTGLNPEENHPTEVALCKVFFSEEMGTTMETTYNQLIKLPEGVKIPSHIEELTGYTTGKVNSLGYFKKEVELSLKRHITDKSLVIAHNANFDLGYLAVHFGIEPKHFICTRTVEILTNPHLNASLQETHNRYCPDKRKIQSHMAMDDVDMLMNVFNEQLRLIGNEAMLFFIDKMAVMPDRLPVYYPKNAHVLDFTEKYVSKKEYSKARKELEDLRSNIAELLDF